MPQTRVKALGTLINDGTTDANNSKALLLKIMLIKQSLQIHISFIFHLTNKKQLIEYSNTIINKEWSCSLNLKLKAQINSHYFLIIKINVSTFIYG